MKPQKFLQRYKCDCFQPDNFCICMHKKTCIDVLMENIADTAESLIEVIKLCGINEVNTEVMLGVINYYFLHFEEVIHRIDSVPRKRFSKEDLMHDLGYRCGMTRKGAQMAFSILKRAFKAFYYGTGPGGVPYRFKDKLTHTSECIWAHAAQRTAEVCACYEGMFYATRKDLECKIKLVYKQLYDRIAERTPDDDNNNECMCENCNKRLRKSTLQPQPSTCDLHAQTGPYEDLYLQEQEDLMGGEVTAENWQDRWEETAPDEKIPCSCPSLSMSENDYMFQKVAEDIQCKKTQEPFECCWFSISREECKAKAVRMKKQPPKKCPCHTSQPNAECKCSRMVTDLNVDTSSELECDAEHDVAVEVETEH